MKVLLGEMIVKKIMELKNKSEQIEIVTSISVFEKLVEGKNLSSLNSIVKKLDDNVYFYDLISNERIVFTTNTDDKKSIMLLDIITPND